MTLQAPCCFQYPSTACSWAISEIETESRREGERDEEAKRGGKEGKKRWAWRWQERRGARWALLWRDERMTGSGRVTGGDGGVRMCMCVFVWGSRRWLVCLLRFVLLCQLSRASVHPAERGGETWKYEDSLPASERKGEVNSCRDGGEQRREAGRGLKVVKIAWAEP